MERIVEINGQIPAALEKQAADIEAGKEAKVTEAE
jgi:hypothetical protein